MNIIFVGKYRGKPVRWQMGLTASSVLLSGFMGLVAVAGYWWGTSTGQMDQLTGVEKELVQQKEMIAKARANAQSELDALAARLGLMQAHVTRLDALGERLVSISKLDSKEFNFTHSPALGGPREPESAVAVEFKNVLGDLSDQLDSREQQLSILEDVLMSKQIKQETRPTGRPIKKGWTSSYYGKRADPFTGKLEMHKGMDFAGREGSEIIAVSSGVVTWAGSRYGYGNLVEINHGHGYTTRYGHNAEILVKVGDTVEKGQPISLMGSTGRSTGPHVHFEVLLNDRQVDPIRFVQSSS
ncbi:MAG: M23 family metallopeptidase [Gammaproteobacteria bacterium]|nr:M23 family metallopeptidase [Gammaproteobacteria bacterium]MCW8922487.1 M23 family metallopeptidase [Gammaproteobacteria bacterium]